MNATNNVVEYRCHTCLLPVANPTDEFCSSTCRDISDDFESSVVVYRSEEQAS